MIKNFAFISTPDLLFGAGKISTLPSIVARFGKHALLVTGAKSFSTVFGNAICENLKNAGLNFDHYVVDREPSPAMVDEAVQSFAARRPDVIVAIGGGSALDAGKAISAMLPVKEPVKFLLEGVGTKNHPGTKIPFIAIPTTSGTGSEATKNAVLSEVGTNGFKRSLRHNNFVPDIAILDPQLTVSCPGAIRASSGMDAFTQLLESYLSTQSNPVTDALAREGLKRISMSLLQFFKHADEASAGDMAMSAYLSGITLANAGLGTIHGFASAVGSYFDIPHGVICSSLMHPVNMLTVRKLRKIDPDSPALNKYAEVGKMFNTSDDHSKEYLIDHLLQVIQSVREEMRIPNLGSYGVTVKDLKKIVSASENKNNPVALSAEEMEEALILSM